MEALEGHVILVTGGTGLVGAHLVELLVNDGATVVVPFRSFHPRSYFMTQHLQEKSIMVSCDVQDYHRVLDVITKYQVEYVVHLAAQPIVPTAYHNPHRTILTNIVGTVNILEAMRQYPLIKGAIVASSDKAYGNLQKTYREADPLRGSHPYDVSKSSADLITQAYHATYHLPVIVTRFGNIYGPGDLHFSRIIPGIMQTAVSGTILEIRSDGKFSRDYIYVKDVALAYRFLLQRSRETQGNIYNIATNEHYTVLELIKKSEKILGVSVPYKILNVAKGETPEQHLDWAKIRQLGWKPTHTLDTVLPETYEWYKQYAFI